MKSTQEQNISYCIYSFMYNELDLSGGELLVFALIYSFSRGEHGSYYGTQEYMARAVGMSESSVRRIISRLLSKKYITACTYSGRRGYKATPRTSPVYVSTAKGPSPPSTDKSGETAATDGNFTTVKPKYTYRTVGRRDMLRITNEQYQKLLTLTDSETIQAYACKLELLIMDNGYRTFSPYKTIKKWILEDHAV